MFFFRQIDKLDIINSELAKVEQQFLLIESEISNHNYQLAAVLFTQAGDALLTSQNLLKEYADGYQKEWPKYHEKLLAMQNKIIENMSQGIYPTDTFETHSEGSKRNFEETNAIIARNKILVARDCSICVSIKDGIQARALTKVQSSSELVQNAVSYGHLTMFSPKEKERVVLGCEPPPGSIQNEDGLTITPYDTLFH